MRNPFIRVRCPNDAPNVEAFHIALDLRLPMDVKVLAVWAKKLPRCPCKAELVIRLDGKDSEEMSDG